MPKTRLVYNFIKHCKNNAVYDQVEGIKGRALISSPEEIGNFDTKKSWIFLLSFCSRDAYLANRY